MVTHRNAIELECVEHGWLVLDVVSIVSDKRSLGI